MLGNGFVFKQLCPAPEGGHGTPERQTEQAEKSRRLELTGCSGCYVTMGSCSNSSVLLCDNGFASKQLRSGLEGDIEHLRCKLSSLTRLAVTGCWCYLTMGSCSNSSAQLQKEDMEQTERKRAGVLYETESDWMLLVCDNGFVFKQLCSAPEGGHKTPEM